MNKESILYKGYLHQLANHINDEYGFQKETLPAIIQRESNWNPNAVNTSGAKGVAQLKPDTLRYLREKLGVSVDPFDPEQAIPAAGMYLNDLNKRFTQYNRPEDMLLRYNAGPTGGSEMLTGKRPYTEEAKEYPGLVEAIRQQFLKKYSPLELMGLMGKEKRVTNGVFDLLNGQVE